MRWGAATLAVVALSCSEPKRAPAPAGQHASPNASLLPAPLAAPSELAPAGPPPGAQDASTSDPTVKGLGTLAVAAPLQPIPVDKPLPADAISAKDTVGYTLTADFRFNDVPGPANVPEVATNAIREAGTEAELKVTIDILASGRMRLTFDARGFAVAQHAELRARAGLHGHVLVWPGGTSYRNVQPGALRAFFEEGRLDVSPLLRAKITPSGTGSRLGKKTAITTIETSLGVLTLEQAVLAAPSGGDLLCRSLSELVGAEAASEACRTDRTPMAAQYQWATGGGLGFLVSSLTERKDLTPSLLATPPDGSRFVPGEFPPAAVGPLVPPETLARLRTRPAGGSAATATTFHNQTNVLQYLLLDGVTVACARPRSRVALPGIVRGRYTVLWRDFFGTSAGIPELLDLPAALHAGSADTDADGGM